VTCLEVSRQICRFVSTAHIIADFVILPSAAASCRLLRRFRAGPGAVLDQVGRGVPVASFALREEVETITRLMNRYVNVPMSLADACLVRMAELYSGSRVMTLDSHFRVYGRNGRQVIPTILPM
jgi:predicted nucleic acid-binding protein